MAQNDELSNAHKEKIDNHFATLSPSDRAGWVATADESIRNEQDPQHKSHKFIEDIAKWLGFGTVGTIGIGAMGAGVYGGKRALKQLAEYLRKL